MTSKRRLAASLLLLSIIFGGCGPDEQIEQYTVPKPHVLLDANRVDREEADGLPPTAPAQETVATRMLAAVVPHGEQTWFFKLMGPAEAVQTQGDAFRSLVQSVRFADSGTPEWTLPEGWRQSGAATEFRFATLQTSAAGETLETTVSSLPSGDDAEEYLIANLSRWRGQLGLPPISRAELPESTTEVELADGTTATLVDFTGQAAAGGGRPPFAPFAGGMGRSPAPSSPSSDASPLSFKTPEGWSPGRSGGMRKAAFVVEAEGQKAEITAIDLTADAGELLSNVNRWREQVGLKPVDQQQLEKDLQPIEVSGEDGWFAELAGPSDGSDPQTILGVIVIHGDRSWFFKLTGDSALAVREKEGFLEFVRSVKFRE